MSLPVAPTCALLSLLSITCLSGCMMEDPWPSLRAAVEDGDVPPDLGCLDRGVTPTSGATVPISAPVVPFGAPPSLALPGVPVRFHLGGVAAPTCEAPACLLALSNDRGIATADLALGARVTTEVPAIDGPTPAQSLMRTLELRWAAGEEDTVNTFSRGTLAAFEAELARTLSPNQGLVAGRVLDCAGRPLSEARVRFFDAQGDRIEGDLRPLYFDGQLPPGLSPEAVATTTDGRYAALDVPPAAARIEAWGSVGDDAPVRIACEPVQVEAATLTVLVLRPTRGDAAAACGR